MSTVKELLQSKPAQIWSIAPNASVYRALELMAEKNIGALLVMEAGKLVGILSERDYARKVILQGRTSKTTAVDELMTPLVYSVAPNNSLDECMALMTTKRIRHLPVLEQDTVVGVISIGDVVKGIITEQAITIKQLENYISSSGYGH
ncbi:MAG: CBS domain-containing protein [Candidatus Latescibacteria bacterium]|nr:CBS domain-containing protein [Candidatus Latescibacterota bacterium]